MSDNRFENHINKQREQVSDAKKQKHDQSDYLLRVSTDFNGSELPCLLDKKQIEMAQEFMELMAKHTYPSAKRLKLEVRIPSKPLISLELGRGLNPQKTGSSLVNKLRWKKLWTGKGYKIGVIVEKHTVFPLEYSSVFVYLCSDFKLRCDRHSPLFANGESYASGVGTIPDKMIKDYNFKVGLFVRDETTSSNGFKNENFEEKLLLLTESALLS